MDDSNVMRADILDIMDLLRRKVELEQDLMRLHRAEMPDYEDRYDRYDEILNNLGTMIEFNDSAIRDHKKMLERYIALGQLKNRYELHKKLGLDDEQKKKDRDFLRQRFGVDGHRESK